MLANGALADSKQYITNLDREKKRIIHNAVITSKKSNLSTNTKLKIGSGQSKKTTIEKTSESFELQEMKKRVLEIEALKKLHQAKNEVNTVQAKIQYQALLAQLFVQRRFEHVIIGTRFYNLIFRNGDTKMRLKKTRMSNGSSEKDWESSPPSPASTPPPMKPCARPPPWSPPSRTTSAHNELHSASKRLTEAYAVGEFLPVAANRRQHQ